MQRMLCEVKWKLITTLSLNQAFKFKFSMNFLYQLKIKLKVWLLKASKLKLSWNFILIFKEFIRSFTYPPMLRVVLGKYGGSHTLYVNGSWYVGISFVISDARDCRLLNCHIARSSSQLGSWRLRGDDFIISPPVGPDFLLLSAIKPLFPPLYSWGWTSDPWPFINTLSFTSISRRIDGKKSINFFCCGLRRKGTERKTY